MTPILTFDNVAKNERNLYEVLFDVSWFKDSYFRVIFLGVATFIKTTSFNSFEKMMP